MVLHLNPKSQFGSLKERVGGNTNSEGHSHDKAKRAEQGGRTQVGSVSKEGEGRPCHDDGDQSGGNQDGGGDRNLTSGEASKRARQPRRARRRRREWPG